MACYSCILIHQPAFLKSPCVLGEEENEMVFALEDGLDGETDERTRKDKTL